MNVTVRRQLKSQTGRWSWNTVDEVTSLEPSQTALVIIDMWAKYWCPSDSQSQVRGRATRVVQQELVGTQMAFDSAMCPSCPWCRWHLLLK